MSKYQVYPEYKNSGVEWLSDIPYSWSIVPIKRLSKIYNGATPKSGEVLFWDGEISWITPADLGKDVTPYIENGSRSITTEGYESCGASLVPENTIILSSRAPIGTLGITAKELCTNQGCKSLVVKEGFIPKYLYYVLFSSTEQLNLLGRGTTFLELSSDELGFYKVGSPSGDEQQKIANFLDHETAKIDTLIEKQQQLIKLLKEKRQAVISHAVTKGLNPNAPMRDSGVEWLGEVPEHWGVCKLKHVIKSLESGVSVNAADLPVQGDEFGVLKTSCVYTRSFRVEENKTVVKEEYDRVKCSIRKGAIIISRMNTPELVGASALVEVENPNIFLPDRLWQTIFENEDNQNPKFISYFMMIKGFRSQISIAAEGASSSMQNIAKDDYLSINIAFPEIKEQNEIVIYVEKKLDVLSNLEAQANKAIDLIQERRTALISAAVTGKIDVRKWQAPMDSRLRGNDGVKESVA